MTSTRDRCSFTWLEALVMALATIFGLIMTKSVLDGYDMAEEIIVGDERTIRGFQRWGYGSVPLFISWSLALVILRLRSHPRGRLTRGPGIVTGLAVALFAVRDTVKAFGYWLRTYGRAGIHLWGPLGILEVLPSWLVRVSDTAGFTIAAAWFTLWVGHWWRPEPNWIDRAGCALGWYWIAMSATSFYHSLVF